MAKSDDGTFGFDELQKAFNKIEQKYPNKTDAMLQSMARVGANKTKARTPVGKTKKLKGTWRVKKPKKYGKARVARVQSANRYAHLVEDGHQIVHGGKSSVNGRKLNALGRKVKGVSVGGRTKGAKMIKSTFSELEGAFGKSAKKLLEDLTRDVEL